MLHAWNIFLVITTFSLSLLGTFLVRSGVLSSVHAFAVDPGRGAYILAFMITVLTVSFSIFMVKGRAQQAQESITSAFSRESVFVWNNVIFAFACATVLLATLYPLALEALTAAKITVGPPYFNAVMVPIFLVVMLLMGVAPLLPWRKANLEKLKSRLFVPAILGVGGLIIMLVFFRATHWTAPVAVGLVGFVLGTIVTDLLRASNQRRAQLNENFGRATLKAILANRRHYGGMVVHLGVLVMVLGFVGSGLFRAETTVTMATGDVLEISGERLRFEGVRTFRKDNYESLQAQLSSLNSGYVLLPERRFYPRQEAPMTESGLHSTLLRDVYVVINERSGDKWIFRAFVFPLVNFIWLGTIVILSGLGLTLSSRRRKVKHEASDRSGLAHAK